MLSTRGRHGPRLLLHQFFKSIPLVFKFTLGVFSWLLLVGNLLGREQQRICEQGLRAILHQSPHAHTIALSDTAAIGVTSSDTTTNRSRAVLPADSGFLRHAADEFGGLRIGIDQAWH